MYHLKIHQTILTYHLRRKTPAGISPSKYCPADRTTKHHRSSLHNAGCNRRRRSSCYRRTSLLPAATARWGPGHQGSERRGVHQTETKRIQIRGVQSGLGRDRISQRRIACHKSKISNVPHRRCRQWGTSPRSNATVVQIGSICCVQRSLLSAQFQPLTLAIRQNL